MKYLKILGFLFLFITIKSCKKGTTPVPTVSFQFKVDGLTVMFTGKTTDANTLTWDFGDGKTSNEENPTHIYAKPGEYTVLFTAKGEGGEVFQSKKIKTLASVEYLLTGGIDNLKGKSWTLDPISNGVQGTGLVSNDLKIDVLSLDKDNIMGLHNLPQVYNDVFTFMHDGTYTIDNSNSKGGSLMSIVYAKANYTMKPPPDGKLVSTSSDTDKVPFADIIYTPKKNLTWSINKNDFNIVAVNPSLKIIAKNAYIETFSGHVQLIVSDYFGFKDVLSTVIIKNITETHMTVAIVFYGNLDPAIGVYLVHFTLVAK